MVLKWLKDLGHFWLGYIRMLRHLLIDQILKGSGLILDMLQMSFEYRHYEYRKCPTSLWKAGLLYKNRGIKQQCTVLHNYCMVFQHQTACYGILIPQNKVPYRCYCLVSPVDFCWEILSSHNRSSDVVFSFLFTILRWFVTPHHLHLICSLLTQKVQGLDSIFNRNIFHFCEKQEYGS